MFGCNTQRVSWWQKIKDHLIQVVPDEIATCEYHCDVPRCPGDRWNTCKRRLRALGEFSLPSE
jgi:hypothetical protein